LIRIERWMGRNENILIGNRSITRRSERKQKANA